MRWETRKSKWRKKIAEEKQRHGEERVITYFALWPITILDETRWWEKVQIVQVYNCYNPYTCSETPNGWNDVRFLN